MIEIELNIDKIYKMPENIFIENIDGKTLVISSNTANWLLLNNDCQYRIFQSLAEGNSISQIFEIFKNCKDDIFHVLTELEAKRFEDVNVNYPQEEGMYVYLTNKCNQRCKHCYMFAGEENNCELTTLEIIKLLKNFSSIGGKVITFTGGEATLRKDFLEIIKQAKNYGLKVCVLSNGLLWNDKFVESVKDFIDEVQISIDGYDRNTYLQVRGVDTFNIVIESVDRLIKAGIRLTIAITPLMETLIGHEKSYISFAKNLLNKYKDNEFFIKFSTELMDGREINTNKKELLEYRISINRIRESCMLQSEKEGFVIDHINNTIFNNCGYGGITVTSTGDIFFCNLITKCAKQGNIRKDNFFTIYKKSKKARRLSDINNLIPCKTCPLKYLCGGGCRIKYFNKLVNQTIDICSEDVFYRDVECDRQRKEYFLRLMIETNELFYR